MTMLQSATAVPVKMLTPSVSSAQQAPVVSHQSISLPAQAAILMRPGQTLHTLPVTLASLNAVGGVPTAGRIAAAIPISQIAPLLDPAISSKLETAVTASTDVTPSSTVQEQVTKVDAVINGMVATSDSIIKESQIELVE